MYNWLYMCTSHIPHSYRNMKTNVQLRVTAIDGDFVIIINYRRDTDLSSDLFDFG